MVASGFPNPRSLKCWPRPGIPAQVYQIPSWRGPGTMGSMRVESSPREEVHSPSLVPALSKLGVEVSQSTGGPLRYTEQPTQTQLSPAGRSPQVPSRRVGYAAFRDPADGSCPLHSAACQGATASLGLGDMRCSGSATYQLCDLEIFT